MQMPVVVGAAILYRLIEGGLCGSLGKEPGKSKCKMPEAGHPGLFEDQQGSLWLEGRKDK